jgi:hypothetical protein
MEANRPTNGAPAARQVGRTRRRHRTGRVDVSSKARLQYEWAASHIQGVLRAALADAVERGELRRSPAARVGMPHQVVKPDREREVEALDDADPRAIPRRHRRIGHPITTVCGCSNARRKRDGAVKLILELLVPIWACDRMGLRRAL